MQSFAVHIRYIPGLKKKAADWLSRLEKHFLIQTSMESKDLVDDNISRLLFINYNFSDDGIPEED